MTLPLRRQQRPGGRKDAGDGAHPIADRGVVTGKVAVEFIHPTTASIGSVGCVGTRLTAAAALSFDELGLEQVRSIGNLIARDHALEQSDRLCPELICGRVDGGERWRGVLSRGDVVVADDGQFVGHGDAEFAGRA